MSLWNRPAPVEPSAAERVAAVVPRCDACLTPGLPTHTVPVPGYGPVVVCVGPVGCRERAQAAGIWKRVA